MLLNSMSVPFGGAITYWKPAPNVGGVHVAAVAHVGGFKHYVGNNSGDDGGGNGGDDGGGDDDSGYSDDDDGGDSSDDDGCGGDSGDDDGGDSGDDDGARSECRLISKAALAVCGS